MFYIFLSYTRIYHFTGLFYSHVEPRKIFDVNFDNVFFGNLLHKFHPDNKMLYLINQFKEQLILKGIYTTLKDGHLTK